MESERRKVYINMGKETQNCGRGKNIIFQGGIGVKWFFGLKYTSTLA
jgi:hypothetical protein